MVAVSSAALKRISSFIFITYLLEKALKLRVISHRFRCFDEHFTFSHLPLVALHVDSIHQMLHSSPHVTIPPRPSLFGKYSISGDQIKKK